MTTTIDAVPSSVHNARLLGIRGLALLIALPPSKAFPQSGELCLRSIDGCAELCDAQPVLVSTGILRCLPVQKLFEFGPYHLEPQLNDRTPADEDLDTFRPSRGTGLKFTRLVTRQLLHPAADLRPQVRFRVAAKKPQEAHRSTAALPHRSCAQLCIMPILTPSASSPLRVTQAKHVVWGARVTR